MKRLLVISQRRLPFTAQVERHRRQRQWLIDLEHLLDPNQSPTPTSASVEQAVNGYLLDLTSRVATNLDETDQAVAYHVNQVFRGFWWGLFACYDVEGLPRTNNELERFMRQVKMGQRRVSGRKNLHDFLIRYGAYAALIDYDESEADLLSRLEQVDQQEFLKERQRLNLTLLQEAKFHRFRCHRETYLAGLENRWDAAIQQTSL